MITRGIIEALVDRTTVKVRIPILNNASFVSGHTSEADLSDAKICILPRCDLNIQLGDVVIVGFESNDLSKPIILGYLYGPSDNSYPMNLVSRSFTATDNAILPQNTSIGSVSQVEISHLSGVTSNLQNQLDKAVSYSKQLEERIAMLEKMIAAIYD